ncbi:DegT/DnrJ/EryC1/StrS family aminotransferase [Pseudobacteriovorax antillogorgiicola]|uniref:dTDP-4-amino-4,6-dideoxygalactose transaminase n=1 Tax=Pseudobacteriovorax antillogorgiicola TaxID=1513793 RepID=A0A1Y6CLH3_9BACT|nr:DegT/DnrJ/EryC1/StrS aminotransferase family protein [Pseudobacteriovorax antillogorgiicola]TCS45196.1 dTDP-4-amino-4,6-dideoxygalactose transaminase [Pseudobacteriovorax antillogorgiicola]SMF75563.1 dTDP-4-amino-4,6-dideoxygalactose transaminase [Pseudobacteriovorax antillogorgiicola]
MSIDETSELFNHIPLARPFMDQKEIEGVVKVIESGWLCQGPVTEDFERRISEFCGGGFVATTNSCTTAIHLALKNIGVEFGDEVVIPNLTCMANANAVLMSGAKPVFADVNPNTFNIEVSHIDRVITSKTKAIVCVDQIGLACDLDSLKDFANSKGIFLIEDAATSLGGKYKGRYLGNHGIPATFSFHPRKMIATGEGGAIISNDEDFINRCKVQRSTGASISDLERHKNRGALLQKYYTSGYNYRFTDLQAAIGIRQLERLPYFLSERKKIAANYDSHFSNHPNLCIPFVPEEVDHSYSSYMLKIVDSNVTPELVIKKMKDKNISCRFGIQPLHQEPFFSDYRLRNDDYPNTVSVAKSSFFLPIFPGLTLEEQNYIVESVGEIFK